MSDTLFEAMLEAQKEIKHAVKDSKNPHFKNDYASLEAVLDAVKPILNKHGLVLVQTVMPGRDPGTVTVKTGVVHAKTKESITDEMPVPLPRNDPQGLGSAITYGRRYGLQAMMAIASEDDDAETASAPKTTKGGSAAEVMNFPKKTDPKSEPASPGAVKEMQDKLNKSLGFTPNAKTSVSK